MLLPIDPTHAAPPPFAADGAELARASFRTAIGDTTVVEERVAIHARSGGARIATGQIADLGAGYRASYRFTWVRTAIPLESAPDLYAKGRDRGRLGRSP